MGNEVTFDSVMIFFGVLLALCGSIVVIGNAVGVIKKLFNPAADLAGRVTVLEGANKDIQSLLKEVVETNKMLCRSMIILMDHEITGDEIEKIRDIKDEMLKYLTKK